MDTSLKISNGEQKKKMIERQQPNVSVGFNGVSI